MNKPTKVNSWIAAWILTLWISVLCPAPASAADTSPALEQRVAQIEQSLKAMPAPSSISSGDNAWMLASAALVLMMTAPGLILFYGGLVRSKNVLGTMMHSLVLMAVMSALWMVFGYSMAFGEGNAFIGNPFQYFMLKGVGAAPNADYAATVPHQSFMLFQMMFAIITPALITGAFTNRVRFAAYLIFLVAWLLCVYFPAVHMVWGNGLLQKWGVLDFAGGIVVHATAGWAALASVFFVGKRKSTETHMHSIPLVALGTGLLWFGWYGFNAGSELAVDAVTGQAFLNTDIAASVAGPVWMFLAWRFEKKPKFTGLLTGAVAGLATVTPCAGFVTVNAAALIGLLAGVVCYLMVNLKNRMGWDDALDVWGVHGIGGCLGTILLGVLASKAVNPAGANGLLAGDASFLLKQTVAVIGASVWAFAFTWGGLWLINRITPVRVSEDRESNVDSELHGETAYDGLEARNEA